MSVDDIFREKAHEKELYSTKKLIKSLFKKYFKREKEIRNELKERIPKMMELLNKDCLVRNSEGALTLNTTEGEISLLLKEYEELITELTKDLKPTLTNLKDKPYKKEIISILRENFKELRENRSKRLSKLLKKTLAKSRKTFIEKEGQNFVFAKAKMNYGTLWHGASIKNFEDIIKEGFFRKRLFLTHDTIHTAEGRMGRGNVILLIDIKGFGTAFRDRGKLKEIVITEKVPIKRILKIYTEEKYIPEVKEILTQNKVNIPILVERGAEFKKDEKEVLDGVNKLTRLYITKYKKLGVVVKTLEEKLEALESHQAEWNMGDEEIIEVWLSGRIEQ